MITYEFECLYGHVTDHRMSINDDTQKIPCSECGENAIRIISRNKNGIGGVPTPVHHKRGATEGGSGPINLGEIG